MKRILSIALAGALCASALVACGGSSSSTAASSAPAASSEAASSQAASSEAAEAAPVENGLQIGQSYTATSDYDYFTYAVAVVQGDTIVAAYLDDFQFFDPADGADIVGVPNSDGGFGANVAEGKVLASKRVNSDYYSANMAKAGSTVAIADNFDAIQNHLNGMTLADALAAEESPVDAISGATLADTAGYINAVLEAAAE